MDCAVQGYRPLVVDATNMSKSKGTKTGGVCSVLDAIMDKTSECVETVHELDDYILKVPGRKRRHADSLAPQTVEVKFSDTLAMCIHKQKSSRQEVTAAAHGHKQKSLCHKDTLITCVHKQKCLQHEDTPSTCVHKQKCLQHKDTPSTCVHKQKCLQHKDMPSTCVHKQKCLQHKDMPSTCVQKQKCLQHKDTPSTCVHKQKCLQHKDTPSTCIHKQKRSQHEDDTSSVISLGSDDEIEIIDIDPKPQLDRSIKTVVDPNPHSGHSIISGVVVDTLHKTKPETAVIDLCSPTVNSKLPVQTQKCMHREDEKMSGSNYTHSEGVFKEYVSVLGDGYRTSSDRTHGVPSVSDRTAYHGLLPLPSPALASSACNPAANSVAEKMQDCEVIFISGGNGGDKMNSASVCGSSVQKHNCSDMRKRLQAIDNRMDQTNVPSSSAYGSNLYNPHPDTVRMGLRPIVIDGSNVAIGHTNGRTFSCRGLQICIDYFLQRQHRVVAFVPQFRKSTIHSQDTAILDILEKQGLVTFTPSRKIGKQLVVPYDDRFIVQYAAECGGVIVSTDNYRDLLQENPAWRETIEKRLLMFTWVGDVIMFPQDPLGRHGPNLESFLRFP